MIKEAPNNPIKKKDTNDEVGSEANSGMTRRGFLIKSAGAVASIGAKTAMTVGPLAYIYSNSERHPDLEGYLESLDSRIQFHVNRFNNPVDLAYLKDNIMQRMPNPRLVGLTYGEYVFNFFESDYFIETDVLPDGVRKGLSLVVQGICAQESKFNSGAVSDKNARGIWQITPIYLEDFNKTINPRRRNKGESSFDRDITFDEVLDTEIATKMVFMSFEVAYERLRDDVDNLLDAFGIRSDEEKDKLMVLIMINAHNTGVNRMQRVMKEFIDQYQSESNNIHINNYKAERLFHSMSVLMKGEISGYGQHSSAYVASCIAGQRVVNKILGQKT